MKTCRLVSTRSALRLRVLAIAVAMQGCAQEGEQSQTTSPLSTAPTVLYEWTRSVEPDGVVTESSSGSRLSRDGEADAVLGVEEWRSERGMPIAIISGTQQDEAAGATRHYLRVQELESTSLPQDEVDAREPLAPRRGPEAPRKISRQLEGALLAEPSAVHTVLIGLRAVPLSHPLNGKHEQLRG